MNGRILRDWLGILAVSALSAQISQLQAQELPREPGPPQASPYTPPLRSFGDRPLGLLEAVRLTLRHDPNLLLLEENVKLREGILQELSGDFDWILNGEFSYQYEEKELLESVKQDEQDRRDDLRRINGETCMLADQFELKAQQIEMALQGQPGDVRITTDEFFDLRLQALENLIRVANVAALPALLNQYQILLESELFETVALAEANREACIESAASLERLGETPEREEFATASLSLRAEKLFRNGLSLAPFFTGDFDHTQYVGKRNGFREPVLDENGEQVVEFGIPRERFVDFGGKNIEDNYTLRVGFGVALPLLRGRGSKAVAAAESAADRDREATALLLKHAAAESVLLTARSYWDLLAAQERVAAVRGSVELQARLVEITDSRIEAGDLIRAARSRVLASSANARALLAAAQRDRVVAGIALVQAMGFDAEGPSHVPSAGDAFPAIAPTSASIAAFNLKQAGGQLAREAVARRYDVAAAAALIGSGSILARAAEIDLRSRLDLATSIWSTATGENSLSEATNRWVAPSWSLGLTFEKPFGNNAARGRLAQSEARLRRDQIGAEDLRRNIRIAVVLTLNSLIEALERLHQTEETVRHYEDTIRAETRRFEAGQVDLVDTILTEQQRTDSLLARIDARREVATLVAQLRFETGTLVAETGGIGAEVTLPALTTLPDLGS